MKAKGIIFFISFQFFIVSLVRSHEHYDHRKIEGITIQKLGKYYEKLDNEGRFDVYWSIGKSNKTVTFDIIARTKGFVGFGITRDGTIRNADIFIGGIREDGTTYSRDYHGDENEELLPDSKIHWGMVDASENFTHTYIRVTRLLDTCDSDDIPIRETGTTRLFWILGKNDETIEKWSEYPNGSKFTNIFPMPLPNFNLSNYKVWEIAAEAKFSDRVYAHWCIIRPGPKLDRKLRIVGYEPIYGSEEANHATHHQTLKLCTPPKGVSAIEIFDQYSTSAGEDCFTGNYAKVAQWCKTGVITRLSGGRPVFFPGKYGIPLEQNSFYSLEVHYSNPQQVKFKSGLRIFYTNDEEVHDAYRIIITSNPSEQAIIIPPNQTAFTVTSHFPTSCIGAGFTLFNVLLHAHHAGRSQRLRHFRNGIELPWILYDEFYDADYQQNRNLDKPVKILPGDHLMMECDMGSKDTAVLGEMCVAIMYGYTENHIRPPYLESQSWVDVDQQLRLLGITKQTTVFDGEHMTTTIHEPVELAGELKDVLSHKFDWNTNILQKFQELYKYGSQNYLCLKNTNHYTSKPSIGPISHVVIPENGIHHPYVKPSSCPVKHHHHPNQTQTMKVQNHIEQNLDNYLMYIM